MGHKDIARSVSTIKQKEDKYSRYDYSKTSIEFNSMISGSQGNIKDSR